MANQLVWFITGCSTGIGRDLTIEALNRGDKVIATTRSRSIQKLEDLRQRGADVLELDVTAPLEELHKIAKTAVAFHGHIDVLVNNAGFVSIGTLEESTPEETSAQFNTNIFGALNVTRSILPYMRARHTGTIMWLGSLAGWYPTPAVGLYAATKVINRLLGELLNQEISSFGLRSMVIEPGYFRTPVLSEGNYVPGGTRIADYEPIVTRTLTDFRAVNGKQLGDPTKLAKIIVDVARGEGVASGKEIPPVLHIGSDTVQVVRNFCNETLQRLDQWDEVFSSTDFTTGT
ncbi:short chain dehydrogenase [Artomyces pyxidatus]|uniref:Short chain dehydrogenase n=1 Tax=Artomyces pyxidatus TaxID=48021 RepID=A0ACB8TJW8_9AGAM|nr:short chain dehydrogenase [Artomyces pyxidatus]